MEKVIVGMLMVLLPMAAVADLVHGRDGRNEYVLNVNSSGQVSTTLLAGEDQTNDVIRTEQQFSYCAAVVADAECGTAANFVHTVTCAQNDVAPTEGKLEIRDAVAAAGGTVIQTLYFTTGVFAPFTLTFDANLSNGLYLDYTTTADVACSASYR